MSTYPPSQVDIRREVARPSLLFRACRDGLPADRIALVIKEIAVPVRYRVETSSHCASLNLAITFVAPHGRLVRVDIGLPDVNPVNLMAATDD